MKTASPPALLALLLAFPAIGAVFDFNAGPQGWSVANLDNFPPTGTETGIGGISLAVTHQASGGNPGGFISMIDPDSLVFYFGAPAVALGNQLAAYGTTLSYDLNPGGTSFDLDPDVVLTGGGASLVIDLGAPAPPGVWTAFSVALNEGAGWHKGALNGPAPNAVEFQNVLANLTGLLIRGEYLDGGIGSEFAGLDNVSFQYTPVPEPLTAPLTATALAVAAGLRTVPGLCRLRRRRT